MRILSKELADPLPGIGASSPALTKVLGKGDDGYEMDRSIVCVAQALPEAILLIYLVHYESNVHHLVTL